MGEWTGLMRKLQINLQAMVTTLPLLSLLKCTFQIFWRDFLLFFTLYSYFPSMCENTVQIKVKSQSKRFKKLTLSTSHSWLQLSCWTIQFWANLNLMSALHTPLGSLHQKGVISVINYCLLWFILEQRQRMSGGSWLVQGNISPVNWGRVSSRKKVVSTKGEKWYMQDD